MNHCDHNHPTREEIRRLPTGSNPDHGAMLVCRRHYEHEMQYRRDRSRETGADKWQFPAWEDLVVEYPAVAA